MRPVEVQEAIFDALTGDPTLLAMLSSSWTDNLGSVPAVFSDTPQEHFDDNDFYPFISFADGVTAPFDDKSDAGGAETMNLSVWTRSANYTQAKQVAARVADILHRQTLVIDDADHITTDMETSEFSLDPDGHTRRGLMIYSILYFDA